MPNSKGCERPDWRGVGNRVAFIEQRAESVRTDDDAEWSRQQNRLIDPQRAAADEMARRDETDPVGFAAAKDRRRTDE